MTRRAVRATLATVLRMNFAELSSGVFVVRYERSEDLAPGEQRGVVEALSRANAEARPVGLVFVVAANVRTVDFAVPAFWLDQLKRLQLRGLAVVSPSRAVRGAAAGFKVSNILAGRNLPVESFADEGAALAWMAPLVARARLATAEVVSSRHS